MSLELDLKDLYKECLSGTHQELLYEDNIKLLIKWGKLAFSHLKTGTKNPEYMKILEICISNLLQNEIDVYNKSVILEFLVPVMDWYDKAFSEENKNISDLIEDAHFKKLSKNI